MSGVTLSQVLRGGLDILRRRVSVLVSVCSSPAFRAATLILLVVASLAAVTRHGVWFRIFGRDLPEFYGASGNPAAPASAANSSGSYTTFDVAGAGNGALEGTVAISLNASGEVAGFYSTGFSNTVPVYHGFVRSAKGAIVKFDAPDAGPASHGGTFALSINSAGDVTGAYTDKNNASHGFVRTAAGVLTEFDAPGAGTANNRGTVPLAINDAGEIVGFYMTGAYNTLSLNHGFVRDPDGTITNVDAPGAGTGPAPNTGKVDKQGTDVTSINNLGEIGGNYVDSSEGTHAFLRSTNGKFVEFDPPDASTTPKYDGSTVTSIDDAGNAFGTYSDLENVRHGFVRAANGVIHTFDAPEAGPGVGTVQGTIPFKTDPSGYHAVGLGDDSNGVFHGFARASNGYISAFDVPAASTSPMGGTLLFGVNAGGEAVGTYLDSNDVAHGLILTLTTPAPALSVASGKYASPQSVKLSDPNSGAAIYYTLDGTTPTGNSTKYTTAISIAKTTTVKAIAESAGYANSPVTTAAYTILEAQTITFTQPASPVHYGVKPIALSATASSGLPVSFSVLSGPGKISGSTLTVTGVGTIAIAAKQPGNSVYAAATVVTRSIVVDKGPQSITFTQPVSPVTYGVKPIALSAKASSGLTVAFSVVSGPAKVTGSTLTMTGAGTVVVAANQAGNADYAPAAKVSRTIIVTKAKLTVTANNLTIKQGAALPTLTYTVAGFVNGNKQITATTGQPVLSTTATTKSAPGTYPITIKAGTLAALNYTFTFVNGTLTVTN